MHMVFYIIDLVFANTHDYFFKYKNIEIKHLTIRSLMLSLSKDKSAVFSWGWSHILRISDVPKI